MDPGKRKQPDELESSPEPCSSKSSSKKAKEELTSALGAPEEALGQSEHDERVNSVQTEEELMELHRKGSALRAEIFALLEKGATDQLSDDDCASLYTSIADLYTNPAFESACITHDNVSEQERAIFLQLGRNYENLWPERHSKFVQESRITISEQCHSGLCLYRINLFPVFLAISDEFVRARGIVELVRNEQEFCEAWAIFHAKKGVLAIGRAHGGLAEEVNASLHRDFEENFYIRCDWYQKYYEVRLHYEQEYSLAD